MDALKKRLIDLSYKYKLSHIGSCLTALPIIDHIYSVKKEDEPFILSNGHAGLALYVVLEKYEKIDAEKLWLRHGVHPNRDIKNGIFASTGSLGHGLGIAVGLALANRKRNVYVLTSDGEMAEGSCYEALRIAGELQLENLRVTVNANGWGAYGLVDPNVVDMRIQYFYPSLVVRTNLYDYPVWLQGLKGHYHVMSSDDYKEITT